MSALGVNFQLNFGDLFMSVEDDCKINATVRRECSIH